MLGVVSIGEEESSDSMADSATPAGPLRGGNEFRGGVFPGGIARGLAQLLGYCLSNLRFELRWV